VVVNLPSQRRAVRGARSVEHGSGEVTCGSLRRLRVGGVDLRRK
jgi:hypothetical protein